MTVIIITMAVPSACYKQICTLLYKKKLCSFCVVSVLRQSGGPVSQLPLFVSLKPLLWHTAVQGSLHPKYWVQMVGNSESMTVILMLLKVTNGTHHNGTITKARSWICEAIIQKPASSMFWRWMFTVYQPLTNMCYCGERMYQVSLTHTILYG